MYYATDDANEGIHDLNNILEASSLIANDYERDSIDYLTDADRTANSPFIIELNSKGATNMPNTDYKEFDCTACGHSLYNHVHDLDEDSWCDKQGCECDNYTQED